MASALPPVAIEAEFEALLNGQNPFPLDREGEFKYTFEIGLLNARFIGQGRQQAMSFERDELLDMLRG